jgi:hypothetical protein
MAKIVVHREHRQIVAEAKLREQRINGSDLEACAVATVPQVRSFDVVRAIRNYERNSVESIQDLCPSFWARKALQQLLEDNPCRKD